MSGAIHTTEIEELGVMVIPRPETTRIIDVLEPLSYRAPSIAKPYCCYMGTVIFYVWPYQTKRDGMSFQEWDRSESLLPWDQVFIHQGQEWIAGGGQVIRWKGGWWMKHWARCRWPASVISASSVLKGSGA